jgi:hypothetical protein
LSLHAMDEKQSMSFSLESESGLYIYDIELFES